MVPDGQLVKTYVPCTHWANCPLTQSIAPAEQDRDEVLEEDVSTSGVDVDVAVIVTAIVTADTSIIAVAILASSATSAAAMVLQ